VFYKHSVELEVWSLWACSSCCTKISLKWSVVFNCCIWDGIHLDWILLVPECWKVRGLLIRIVAMSHGTNFLWNLVQTLSTTLACLSCKKKLYMASLSPVTKDFAAGDRTLLFPCVACTIEVLMSDCHPVGIYYLTCNLQRVHWTTLNWSLFVVFASSVLWTKKIHRTKLNWTVVQSIFRLQLPKFGVIPVASCLI